jgi:hypothetical protein
VGTFVGLLLLIAGASALQLSCAARAPQRSVFADRDAKHNEILLYLGKIVEYRKDMGLSDHPTPREIELHHGRPIEAPPAAPASDASEICLDICDLAERICENQEDICKIAQELGSDDEWAQEKCDSAKASCKEAKRRCTDCQ